MTEHNRPLVSAWVDPDDAPELTDDFFEQAEAFVGDKLVRCDAEVTQQGTEDSP